MEDTQMTKYVKPVIIGNEELAEGIYAASGEVTCESKYMNGEFAEPQRVWNTTMKEFYGCQGCHGYTGTGNCGLKTHYIESGYASSYEGDRGCLKPTWEQRGYTDVTIVDGTTFFN
jgi:hypothetical protein